MHTSQGIPPAFLCFQLTWRACFSSAPYACRLHAADVHKLYICGRASASTALLVAVQLWLWHGPP